jgi:hypothetical protein
VLDPFRRACVLTLIVAALSPGCTGRDTDDGQIGWTKQQAESVTVVRGMTVRVRRCRGLGPPLEDREQPAYRRFRCLAGARARFDPYGIDTVAVVYLLHPAARYSGPSSAHRLSNVRFVGGPGIP